MFLGYLRQSTASQTVVIGPFVDDTDFKTAETALTIANTDVKLSKAGAAEASKNSGGGTHRSNGYYGFTFNATDSDTVGRLDGHISVAGALTRPFWFQVLEENVYDKLFADGADLGTHLDLIQAIVEVLPTAVENADEVQTRTIAAVTSVVDKTGFELSAPGIAAILDDAVPQPTQPPSWAAMTVRAALAWLAKMSKDRVDETGTTQTVFSDDDTTAIGTSTVSDDGSTATRGRFS